MFLSAIALLITVFVACSNSNKTSDSTSKKDGKKTESTSPEKSPAEVESNSTSGNSSAGEKSNTIDNSIPESERNFIDAVESYYDKYESAPNELKKSTLRMERQKEIKNILKSVNINNWVGNLRNTGTNSKGKAYIEITLANSKIRVETWNNGVSDAFDNTLIPNGSTVYNQIAELSKGDMVVFSGKFLKDSDGKGLDYIKEMSLTENGSMTKPEFLFIFSNVEKK